MVMERNEASDSSSFWVADDWLKKMDFIFIFECKMLLFVCVCIPNWYMNGKYYISSYNIIDRVLLDACRMVVNSLISSIFVIILRRFYGFVVQHL